MRLLLDLGNTRIKWGTYAADGGVANMGAHAWDERTVDVLRAAFAALTVHEGAWAASVVESPREIIVADAVRESLGQTVTWVRTPREACGVRNAYVDHASLGVDRFLAMVAAHADGRAPCVLAGAGTALTLDALAGDGRHLGGWIAPGPRLMHAAVRGATAKVKPASTGRIVDAASSTADALTSGSWHACAALVDRFAARMQAGLGGVPAVLLYGGDADVLLPLVEHAATHYPDAVLRGLARWADGTA